MGFDADTGRLDVAPDASAYGTQLRWKAPKLTSMANERVRDADVRAVHVLAPALVKAVPATAAVALAPQSAVPAVPVERRTPPEGYRRAIRPAPSAAARPRRPRPPCCAGLGKSAGPGSRGRPPASRNWLH